jgi:hypothetical protein
MKTFRYYSSLLFAAFTLCACDAFEIDNYKEPGETIEGIVVDAKTGEPVLTDQGSEGIRVRLTELSYGDNVDHNPDFYCRPDGTFRNTKIFAGNYNIRIDGPFIPIYRDTDDGTVISDDTWYGKISGTTNVKFEVHPFLKVEFVETPSVSNGQITAKVKVTRATTKEEFRNMVEPLGGYRDDFTNVTDIQLFVSMSSSVGYRARDQRWSSQINYAGDSFDAFEGQPITIRSANGQTIPSGRHVFVRAAARINYDTPRGSGTRRWNYSEPLEVIIP